MFIYVLVEKARILYVGKTGNPSSRMIHHRCGLKTGTHFNKRLLQLVSDYTKVELVVIDQCDPIISRQVESYWYNFFISIGEDLCNLMDPVESYSPNSQIEAVRARISEKQRGRAKGEKFSRKISTAKSVNGKSTYDAIDWMEEDLSRCYMGALTISKIVGCTEVQARYAISKVVKKYKISRPMTPSAYNLQIPYRTNS